MFPFSFWKLGAPAPALVSLNYDQADTAGGGQSIVITGTDLGGASSVTWGGTACTITGNTSTTVTVTLPAKAAGSHNIVVTTAGGTSNALALEAWDPTVDTTCTLLYDSLHTAYNAGAGTWAPRFGTDPQLACPGTPEHPADNGAPSFDGNGSDEAGLKNGAQALSDYVGASGADGGTDCPGTIAAVFTNTTSDTSNSYLLPGVLGSNGPSGTGAILGGRTLSGVKQVGATVFDAGSGQYVYTEVASDTALHACVARWSNTTSGGTLEVSVDGATGGGGFSSAAISRGTHSSLLGHVHMGLQYDGASATQQKFAGIVRAACVLNRRASDTFLTKHYKWAKQRFGVA